MSLSNLSDIMNPGTPLFASMNRFICMRNVTWKLSGKRTAIGLGRLASLGIMGDKLRASLKPPVHRSTIVLRGSNGARYWVSFMPRDASHLDNLHREILLNQTEIRLYLPCADWFGSKRTSVWIQIIRCMVNTIWFRFNSIIFRKDFLVYNIAIVFPTWEYIAHVDMFRAL